VPYRDSKLTRLLQTSLGGNAKTHLLLACSASPQHVDETMSTLRFGSRAKNIQNSPHVNNETAGAAAEYGELLTTLQNKIESLHSYIRQLETTRCDACKGRGAADRTDQEPPDPANEVDESDLDDQGADLIADDLVRSEMQSLRKALTSMKRDHEAQDHAHHVTRAMMAVTEQQLDARRRSQEHTIQRQQLELQDAFETISRLEKKLELLEESARVMSAELHRWRGQQQHQQAGESAEVEILRRQLETAIKQSKQLQTKLVAAHQEQEDVADLRERLVTSEHELSSLRSEVGVLRVKKLPVAVLSASLPSPHRAPQPRPVTAVELKSTTGTRGDAMYLHAGTSNIQSWWAGDSPAPNQEESAAWLERHVLDQPLPISGGVGSSKKRESALPPADSVATRVSSSASSSVRPFRARLVGLLNSLEEETTAYKELVVETKERAASRSGSRPRRHLPCLDGLAPPPTTP